MAATKTADKWAAVSRDQEITSDAAPGSEMLTATRWWVWRSGRVNEEDGEDGEINGGIV